MLLAVLLFTATGTITTGADYLNLCRESALSKGVDGQLLSVTCVSFVNGFARGFGYADSMTPQPAVCMPATSTTTEVMDAIEARLRADGQLLIKPIEEVAWGTLTARYPCPKAPPPPVAQAEPEKKKRRR